MLVNYFELYNINTDEVSEKLGVISKHNTENASFFNNTFKNAIEYLFMPVKFEANYLMSGIPNDLEKNVTIVYFDSITEENSILNEFLQISNGIKQLIILGNHKNRVINEKIICINIHHFTKLKTFLNEADTIKIGFNLESVNNDRYYYGRMRSYFLNVLSSLKNLNIDELIRDVESECTKLLLNEDNFICYHSIQKNQIITRDLIRMYKNIVNYTKNRIKGYAFYITNSDLNDYQISMLNTISELFWIYRFKEIKDVISYSYDQVCTQMLEEAKKLKYCHFIHNVCASTRYTDNSFPNSKENGCCNNTYKDRKKNCRYLKEDYSCAICSISCRVFTCGYLQKRGIDHSLWQYPLIDCVFGKLSRPRIIYGFFLPKEKMIKKL